MSLLTLHPSMVLVSPDTAAAVLGTTSDEIRDRVDMGRLAAFDFSRADYRRRLRIWVGSMSGSHTGAIDLHRLCSLCAAALFRDRAEVSVVEIGRRCSLDRPFLHRMIARGELTLGRHGVSLNSWRQCLYARSEQCPEIPTDSVVRTHAHSAIP